MEESRTLRDEIRKLNESITDLSSDKKKKEKKFRFPWRARVNKTHAKKGYTSVCYINENRGVNFMKVPIKDGTVMINEIPYLATTDYMLTYKNKPFLIIPSWNTEPFSPGKDLDDAKREKKTAYGYRLLLNKMKSETIEAKKKFGGIGIILVILALAAAAYYFFGGKF